MEGLVDGVQISHKIGVNHKLILMAVLLLSEFVNPFPLDFLRVKMGYLKLFSEQFSYSDYLLLKKLLCTCELIAQILHFMAQSHSKGC